MKKKFSIIDKNSFISSNLTGYFKKVLNLDNLKLIKEIKIKINLTNLEKDCKKVSKTFF